MPPGVIAGELILRAWDRTRGLSESSESFTSLDELYAYCLSTGEPQLIDRIIIHGQDAQDHPRVLTFVFQSITVSPQTE